MLHHPPSPPKNKQPALNPPILPTTMAFPDWCSLPADLVNRIAECFLATSDLDYYMDFRAVCHSWRSATEDPRNSADPRFRPRQWVEVYGAATALFVNTNTGRFLRKELPLLHNYFVAGATSDGLLVLTDIYPPQAVSVLNPFTGYIVRFMALPPGKIVESAALVSSSSPTLILVCKRYIHNDDYDVVFRESPHKVYMTGPDSKSFAVYEDKDACPLIRLAARGMYTNGELGWVAPFPFAVAKRIFDLVRVFNADPAHDEVTMMSDEEARYENRFFLVSSAGEMLIIFKLQKGMEVYRMDTDRYTLDHVDNIGNRAIFLGDYIRCMSVNSDKFPSIEANCIYYIKGRYLSDDIYMYNIMRRREERICEAIPYGFAPYTIIQHLCHSIKGF